MTNLDKDGFWDAVKFVDRDHGYLLGDPVKQEGDVAEAIVMKETVDGGRHWREWRERPGFLQPKNHLFIFAASNSSMVADQHAVMFGAGGNSQAGLVTLAKQGIRTVVCDCPTPFAADVTNFGERAITFQWVLMATGASAGVFSVASGPNGIMLVGGDYKKPASSNGNAAFVPSGDVPRLPQNPPHGYRSAVAYDPPTNTWITVGPNGTDVSTDDGKNWRALKPSAQDDPEADQHWNALSLPFVVGPKGRIGVLRLDALKPSR